MSTPTIDVIIPTHNHARFLPDAIESVIRQTVPCRVIVVDDGSTDATADVLARFATRENVHIVRQEKSGPSVARNAGLVVSDAEFVMFLDADDVIAPTKVEKQLAAFDESVGWVLCDVSITSRGSYQLASARYDYAAKELGGWIRDLLVHANFIPIMAPLVRRSVLDAAGIRFSDARLPEDWYFWLSVAAQARVRYVPEVLATYRKQPGGRNSQPKPDLPAVVPPLRLNLGCGNPSDRSWHPIDGFVNLDKCFGWCFEDGLKDYADSSVAGITVSHALMYVDRVDWPFVCREFARVLAPGGVVRITEDETIDPASSRRGGWKGSQPAVTLTSPSFVREHLEASGLIVFDVSAGESNFRDLSLCQQQHGDPPDVFFIEGVKPSGVLFSPHNDDETLFAAFTIQQHRPAVVVCFQSSGDYGDSKVREAETRAAVAELRGGPVTQWDGADLEARMRALDAANPPVRVWAPSVNASHPDHVAVGRAAAAVFGNRVTFYDTYQDGQKVRSCREVLPAQPQHLAGKLRALACYQSQIAHPRANRFFFDDLREYEVRQ